MTGVVKTRHQSGRLLIMLAFVLVAINVLLFVKLNHLVSTGHDACVANNALRADARVLLRQSGHAGKAVDPALRNRPCEKLYDKNLFWFL